MLRENGVIPYQNFAYRYIIGPQLPPTQLYSFGWQLQKSQDYYFHGLKRNDEQGNCIFQYTLSGSGIFEINGKQHLLREGMAFISDIPSNHCYFLPKESTAWEFVYVTLTGHFAAAQWKKIQEQFGNILYFTVQDDVIGFFQKMYSLAVNQTLKDGYETSAIAYEFIMYLWKSLVSQAMENPSVNHSIDAAIYFMKNNYQKNINLEDIASSVAMSKFHFNRTFLKATGVSPWKYLTKLRVKAAANLLLTTNLTNEDISKLCGYESSNYFDKVFRKYVSMSPGKFRQTYDNIDNFTFNL